MNRDKIARRPAQESSLWLLKNSEDRKDSTLVSLRETSRGRKGIIKQALRLLKAVGIAKIGKQKSRKE